MNPRSEKFVEWPLFCIFSSLMAITLLMAGCASPNVNPARAQSGKGYVDFYCETNEPLCWQIAEINSGGQRTRVDYSSFDPLDEQILRLALAPGRYHLRIGFLNKVVLDRGNIEIEIKEGMITPVHVTLASAGTTLVERKESSIGPTFYGRSGRTTSVGSYETQIWRVEAAAADSLPYQTKDQMAYYKPIEK